MIRLSRATPNRTTLELEALAESMTHSLLVHVGFETLYRESLDSAKVAEPARLMPEPFRTITESDIDTLFIG